jgi:predicted RNA-binding protein with EMAP domain|tara:strand:+ start:222 stop:506 length:285 start_codon:yes stop_codon:yes gene_type:complete
MDRTKYIIVFKDVTVWNPESRELSNLYKAYLPAEHLMSAELMAKMVKGTVVGMIDNDGSEYYFENDMETAVRENVHPLNSTIPNYDIQSRRKKN